MNAQLQFRCVSVFLSSLGYNETAHKYPMISHQTGMIGRRDGLEFKMVLTLEVLDVEPIVELCFG